MTDIYTIPSPLPSNATTSNFKLDDISPIYVNAIENDYEIQKIIRHFSSAGEMYDVGKQGLNTDDGYGSKRISSFDVGFAEYLNGLLKDKIPRYIDWNENNSFDNKVEKTTFVYQGISPFFRYMEYSSDGEHFPHYDAPFVLDGEIQTVLSGVLYLSTNAIDEGGQTVFVDDVKNQGKVFKDRDTSDWVRNFTPAEKIVGYTPKAGNVLLFPHQMCHAVSPFLPKNPDDKRIIIRFDVYYKGYE